MTISTWSSISEIMLKLMSDFFEWYAFEFMIVRFGKLCLIF